MVSAKDRVERESEHFGRMADDWWDPKGSSAMLHRLNPVRLAYIRDRIDQHWQVDEHGRRPLEDKRALDVGCGAGLLAEPLARLGAEVTGVEPSAELVEAARTHAEGQRLAIDYRQGTVEQVPGRFDLITAMEVIEHTADPQAFLGALSARLAADGLLILSTPNKTAWSRLLTITLAEGFGAIPKGTHDFDQFIEPERMKRMLGQAGLECIDVEGIAFSPMRGLHLSEDVSLNYLVAARARPNCGTNS